MRSVVLLLPISFAISGPTCVDILPRDLDLFDDQSTAPADDWLAQSTEPTDDWLVQSTAPVDDWLAQSTEPTDDWLLLPPPLSPPAEPFADFDPDQDTVSTDLFDLPRSSTSPLTELDLSSPFSSEPLADVKYSTISADQTAEEIAARKCHELDEWRRRPYSRPTLEESQKLRFFDVPLRKCDSGTIPFCTLPIFVTPDTLGVTLRNAVDLRTLLKGPGANESPCIETKTIYCCSEYSVSDIRYVRNYNDGTPLNDGSLHAFVSWGAGGCT